MDLKIPPGAVIPINTLGEISTLSINEPPPPPEGSSCDYFCDLSPTDPDSQAKIFGEDPTFAYRWWAQYVATSNPHWTRFGFTMQKGGTCTEPVYIGFVKESVINDINLFLDMANWESLWADQPDAKCVGVYDDTLPSSSWYWLGINCDYQYNSSGENIIMVMISWNPNSISGWRTGARTHGNCVGSCFYGWLDGSTWNWTPPGGNVQLMSCIFTEGGGALFEGHTTMENPSFPDTAQNNEEWLFSFELYNDLMSFCACPEMLWFKLWQLDSSGGNKVGDPVIDWAAELPCGYYFPIGGSITFNEMGGYPFYGLLEVGHVEGSTFVMDGHGSFDVWVNCTEDVWGCDENGDKWICINGDWVKQTPSPHPDCYTTCEEIPTKTACEDAGCLWWNDSCHSVNPTSCDVLNNQNDCETWGCIWEGGSCRNPTCEDLNEADCEPAGCYWYDNSCHSYPQPADLCQWITDHGGAYGLTVDEVFIILDSYIFQVSPSGYGFIPSLQQLFGVIDYYLGFDGDQKTGCDFY